MKKIYLIISVLFISFGCGEDFTSINPKGVLADATLQNAGGVNLLLTSAYSALDGIYNGAGDPWFSTGDNGGLMFSLMTPIRVLKTVIKLLYSTLKLITGLPPTRIL